MWGYALFDTGYKKTLHSDDIGIQTYKMPFNHLNAVCLQTSYSRLQTI